MSFFSKNCGGLGNIPWDIALRGFPGMLWQIAQFFLKTDSPPKLLGSSGASGFFCSAAFPVLARIAVRATLSSSGNGWEVVTIGTQPALTNTYPPTMSTTTVVAIPITNQRMWVLISIGEPDSL